MAAKPKPSPKGDPLVERMDAFAGELLTAAQVVPKEGEQGVDFRDKLDTFREVARWVSVKKGMSDAGGGESIHEFKARIHAEDGEADRRAPRRFGPRRVISTPPNSGGAALDAIKGRLPDANPRHDAGGGNGVERASLGAAGSLGLIHPGGDGDE